jgi:hypothetical protein
MIITSLQLISGPKAVSYKIYKCWTHEDKKQAIVIIPSEIYLNFC